MQRNSSLITFSALSLTLAATSCQRAEEPQKMNILFIPIDDLRAELPCYGASEVIAPNIEKLASRGTVFQRAYCQESISNPSRSSLLTGLRPDEIRVWDLYTHFRSTAPDVITIPQHFKESGYNTIGYGKIFHNIFHDTISWDVKYHIDGFPFDPDATYAGEENLAIIEQRIEDYKARGINTIDELGQWYVKAKSIECVDVDDDAYYDGLQTDAAVIKLGELAKSDEPFFLAVGYYRPHLPFTVPKKYWDMYNRDDIPVSEIQRPADGAPDYALGNSIELRNYIDRGHIPQSYEEPMSLDEQRELKHGYYASVSYVDALIGKLVKALEDNDLIDNTIIVLWGDNGYKLGEYNSWCKQSNYEVDTRVPLIIVDPRINRGVKQTALVEFVDIFPTLCEMTGLSTPEELSGESLTALLRKDDQHARTFAYSQYLRGRFTAAERAAGVEQMGYTVRSDRFRFVEWYRWDGESDTRQEYLTSELYDHESDPLESVNVVNDPQYRSVVEEHQRALREMFK